MLELAIAGSPCLSICPIELDTPGVHYSVDSLSTLVRLHPTTEFCFLIGEDSLEDLHTWRDPQRLVRLAAPVVAARPRSADAVGRAPRVTEVYGVPVRWLTGEPIDLSSSELRLALARGRRPGGIPPAVLDYICAEALYDFPEVEGDQP